MAERRLPGLASAAGTRRGLQRAGLNPGGPAVADWGELALCRLGWGTQSGDWKNIVDLKIESALPTILAAGLNLVDTSPAYRARRSQAALGRALAKALRQGLVARDELVLTTQVGWLALDRKEEDPREFLLRAELPGSGLAESDFVGAAWSLHPDWITRQLELSCRLLGVEAFDLLLLSAPEMALRSGRSRGHDRLRAAFERCEELRAAGRIGAWGLSSLDGFRAGAEGRTLLDPAELAALAREAAGPEHGLRAAMLPYSLGMLDLLNGHTPSGVPLQQAFAEAGCLVIGALSLGQGQLAHGLPPSIAQSMPGLDDAQRALQFARSTPGLGCALVGMKTREHIEANLALLQHPPLGETQWRALFN
jgi:aryl-alcohol dehydrogenase-like predicted oxidoreductase